LALFQNKINLAIGVKVNHLQHN